MELLNIVSYQINKESALFITLGSCYLYEIRCPFGCIDTTMYEGKRMIINHEIHNVHDAYA